MGLTGGIASGKSLVAARLAELGAVIIDSDLLAREVVGPGTDGQTAVAERFGAEMVTDSGLDRALLGALVFADPGARADLERIVHPRVRQRAAELEQAADPDAVVVQVIPLLVETGHSDRFDLVVVVDADPEDQVRRLRADRGLTEAEARSRLAAQATREQRLAAADVVLANTGTVDELGGAVDGLWARLRRRSIAGA